MQSRTWIATALVAAGLMATGPSFAQAQEELTVWWVKGFCKAEDDALFGAIKKFEAKHRNIRIELSQYPVQDMIPTTMADRIVVMHDGIVEQARPGDTVHLAVDGATAHVFDGTSGQRP